MSRHVDQLGYGNTPVDVVSFALTHQGQTSKWLVVANAARTADLISLDATTAANREPGLTTPVSAPFEPYAGVRSVALPITNVIRLLDQNEPFLLILRRDPETGAIELMSFRKGAFFRLSDHVNEYDFPTYAYPEDSEFQQTYIRPFHAMMKTDEGHEAVIK